MLLTWWCVGVVVFDDGVDIVVRWVSVGWRMVVVKMMMVIVIGVEVVMFGCCGEWGGAVGSLAGKLVAPEMFIEGRKYMLDKILSDEFDQVKKKSFEIQKGLRSRIKIRKKDVQRCQKQSVDFELKLQHEKEKHKWDSTSRNKNTNPLDYSWISKLKKLENENVSLDFKVQSLIKERDNVKIEYQKLFDSIKKTRSQTQKEMDELIVHVSEKTYVYGVIHAENQDLLSTMSELKTRLEKLKKKTDVSKTEENHVVSKPVTLQTSSNKQTGANQNKNVIKPGMYRVVTTQESQINKTKSGLSSTGVNATSRVRRPMSKDSSVTNSVLVNSKKAAKNVSVYVRKNKQKDNTSANVISNKENVIDVDVANASKAENFVMCFLTFSTNSRTPKSLETTYVAPKTRFSKKETQSKTLDTTSIVSKSKIDVESASKAKDKVVQIILLDLVDGLPKFKYGKDHLCSACKRGKSKKASHPPKLVPSDYSKLELLHMDLCGPIRFDELTSMASEHDCLEPELQRFNNHNSSAEQMNTSSKEDLDNLFGPIFEEYYEQKSSDTTIYFVAQPTQVHDDSPSTYSIIVDTREAPLVVTTFDEQTSPISLTEADEFNQEDTTDFDGNAQFVRYNLPSHEEIESSTTALEPSNVQNFHQVQPSTHI
ncbi:hypothetical protein Tco_1449197 [Tanacetum coccineum]